MSASMRNHFERAKIDQNEFINYTLCWKRFLFDCSCHVVCQWHISFNSAGLPSSLYPVVLTTFPQLIIHCMVQELLQIQIRTIFHTINEISSLTPNLIYPNWNRFNEAPTFVLNSIAAISSVNAAMNHTIKISKLCNGSTIFNVIFIIGWM